MGEGTRGGRSALAAVLAVVGLALFLSSMWTARADASGVSTGVVYCTRLASFSTYMVMAWSFRNHLPQVSMVLVVAVASMSVHLAQTFLQIASPGALGDGVSGVVCYVSGIFEGIANALLTLLFAHVLSTLEPRRSCVAIGAGFVGVDIMILALDTMGPGPMHVTRPLFTLASLVILSLSCKILLSRREGGRGLQYGMSRPEGEEPHAFAFFSAHTDWLLLLIVAFLFPSLFGVIAQVSSETGGNFALYDVETQIVIVALESLFLLFLAARGSEFGFGAVLAFEIPLFATGFALFPGAWEQGNAFAGCLIRGGYALLSVMLWSLMARKAYDDPRHTYLYFSIYCGISNAQAGRLLGSYLMRDTGPNLALCQSISLWALWAICIFGLVLFFLLQRGSLVEAFGSLETMGGARGGTHERDASGAGDVPGAGGRPFPTGVDSFAAQLESFCDRVGLTPREREVVVEALHGYSRTSIASKLGLSPETVKTYLNRAYSKAGVTSKQALVAVIERERV